MTLRSRGRLKVVRIAVGELEQLHIEQMWSLYTSYYENVVRSVFDRDLCEKQIVFVALDPQDGSVRGFSTATIDVHAYRGQQIGVYFSGDTIVEPRYWGQKPFHRIVAMTLLRWRLRHPFTRLYWHLTCNGYRTFLTLVRNCPEHWPHRVRGLPHWERGFINSITRERFGSMWLPEAGVVRDNVRMKPNVAPFTAEVRRIPAVQFFLELNPGYATGDELSIVGRVNTRCFLSVAAKSLRSTLRHAIARQQTSAQELTGVDHPALPDAERSPGHE